MPPRQTRSRAALLRELKRLERAARPLDPGPAERRALRRLVVDSSERFLASLGDQKGFEATAGTGEGLLASPIGETGLPAEEVIRLLEREVVTPGGHPGGPSHLAYIPGSNLYHAALGDFLAAISNKYAGIFFTGPGAVRMENQLLRWVADLVGYPAQATGNIASGGSVATLIAIATARDAHGITSARVPKAVVYLTTQAHHCVDKALRIAGLGEAIVRHIDLDAGYRMRPDALAARIAADRAAGLTPWLVVGTAGTTDTGAVDPLATLGAIARREGCWFHVDAAYGGFFLLTERGRLLLEGIAHSDSVVLDPHKGLFIPFGSGVVLVRDPRALRATHHYMGNYLQDAATMTDELSPADLSPELSKHFRGPRMWLPLKLVGVTPFRAALEEKLLLARYAREELAAAGFEVGPEPDLTVVTYRWAPPGLGLEEVDRLNQRINEYVHQDGRVFLSSTMLDGRYTLRLVVLGFRTHRRTIDTAITALKEAVAAL